VSNAAARQPAGPLVAELRRDCDGTLAGLRRDFGATSAGVERDSEPAFRTVAARPRHKPATPQPSSPRRRGSRASPPHGS